MPTPIWPLLLSSPIPWYLPSSPTPHPIWPLLLSSPIPWYLPSGPTHTPIWPLLQSRPHTPHVSPRMGWSHIISPLHAKIVFFHLMQKNSWNSRRTTPFPRVYESPIKYKIPYLFFISLSLCNQWFGVQLWSNYITRKAKAEATSSLIFFITQCKHITWKHMCPWQAMSLFTFAFTPI